MERLKSRASFRAVARGARISRQGFVLQALKTPVDTAGPRFGFTVTKKIGNAVVRNRIRRRLREAVRLSDGAAPGVDYVLVGRHAALTLQFDRLVADLRSGFLALAQDDKVAQRPPDVR